MYEISKGAKVLVVFALIGIALWFISQKTGFYSVQPIGALPEGVTLFVSRTSDEPFFNSPDATCLRKTGKVTLLCRGFALGKSPHDRIIMRLSYWEFAYKQSIDGQEFER
jgi:hypothetical protein